MKEDFAVSLNNRVRQLHRWISMALTLAVVANFVALAIRRGQQPPDWVTYSPLLPLALLMMTGVYLFVLPYVGRRRGGGVSGSA